MMTFYAAVGCYRIKTEGGHHVPYIQKLGKLHPISIPEFVIWSTLLWEVMTYQELEKHYNKQILALNAKVPPLDELLEMMIRRKLLIKGVGYTGQDALYNMLSNAFIIPYRLAGGRKLLIGLKLAAKGKIPVSGLLGILKGQHATEAERRVLRLIEQTPLSTAELVRCFERNITDVSTPEKVLASVYPESTQAEIAQEEVLAHYSAPVIEAVSNLYLGKRVLIEVA